MFRAPVGGLFRHVLDSHRREQIARGHRVGLIADSNTGGARAERGPARNSTPSLALGLTRIPMRRHAGPGDMVVLAHVMRRIAQSGADVVHGHGAKGGAYARLAFNNPRAVRAYTPHGGSLLFGHDTLAGKFYLATERLLMLRGDLFLFESAYSAEMFRRKIGTPGGLVRIVHNGVSRKEFEPVETRADATDLVFMGELRPVKGIDVLIDAIAQPATRRPQRDRDAGRRRPRPRRRCTRRSSAWGSPPRSASCRRCRRARRKRSAASWWCRRGPNPCPMWCWRRPPPACR